MGSKQQYKLDKVRHEEMLKNQCIDGKNIQLIWSLCWEQTAAIRLNNEIYQFKKLHWICIKAVCFHQTFSIYMEKTS